MAKKKVNKVRAGFITILFGPAFAVCTHFAVKILDIDLDQSVMSSSNLEIWSFIGLLSIVCVIALGFVFIVVDGSVFLYKKLTGVDKNRVDYF